MEIHELVELGMTKAELARALGIRVQTIYKWKVLPGYVEGFLLLMRNRKELLVALEEIRGEEYGSPKD